MFRVTPEQLEARSGKVRCGKCAFVFNAFDTLVTPIETVSLIAPPPEDDLDLDAGVEEEHITLQPAPLTVAEPLTASFPIPTDDQIQLETEEINRSIAETAHLESLREERKKPEKQKADESAPDAVVKKGLEITPDLQEKLQSLQNELSSNEKRARWSLLVWGLGVLVLFLLAMGQLAYFKRDILAARYPDMAPTLESLCNVLGCKISLLADAEQIKLDSSDLQSDPDRSNAVILSATLRNLAPYRQAYPNLELTLTATNNQPIARRYFTPKEYLGQETKPESGMPSNEDVLVRLPLELADINAVGYKLFIYYP